MPPVYVFAIDVSAAAYASGMVSIVAQTIRACLDKLPGDERTLVGFLTFDRALHFYNLKPALAAPQVRHGSRDASNSSTPLHCTAWVCFVWHNTPQQMHTLPACAPPSHQPV
jgi:Sec23/Sec24 trunk domain